MVRGGTRRNKKLFVPHILAFDYILVVKHTIEHIMLQKKL
jgi:hypothetical protein